MTLTEKELERAEDKYCCTKGCFNYSQRGYIYCLHCMNLPPIKMGKRDKELKKLWDKERSK